MGQPPFKVIITEKVRGKMGNDSIGSTAKSIPIIIVLAKTLEVK